MHISFVRILKNNARYGKINAYIFVPIKNTARCFGTKGDIEKCRDWWVKWLL